MVVAEEEEVERVVVEEMVAEVVVSIGEEITGQTDVTFPVMISQIFEYEAINVAQNVTALKDVLISFGPSRMVALVG